MRNKLVEIARTYLGVPFKHQGRTRRGLDCAGLVILVGREAGFLPVNFDVANYSRMPNISHVLNIFEKYGVEKQKAEIGDIYIMDISGNPQHLSIKTDIGIIHSTEFTGKVVEHILNKNWMDRTYRIYAWKGLA